jgi:hypothetical protein
LDPEPFFTPLGKPLPILLELSVPDTDPFKSAREKSAIYPYELTANLSCSPRRHIFPHQNQHLWNKNCFNLSSKAEL